MTNWTASVPNVSDGQPITADSVNNPVNNLAQRTQVLKTLLDAIEAGNNLLLRNVPMDASVSSGMMVYFDPDTYTYKPAQAVYGDLTEGEDTVEPAQSAHFSGVSLNVTGNIGDLGSVGVFTLAAAEITALFGTATPDRGQYYLSSTVAGTATAERPILPVLALEYMGSNMLRVYQPAFNNLTHTHREYSLETAGWITTGSFDPSIVPAGATLGYDFTIASAVSQNLVEVLLPSVNYGVFTWAHNDPAQATDGLRVAADSIIVDENGIWWTEVAAPTSDMWLNATAAQVGDVPVINTIISRTPDNLSVSILDGTAYLTIEEYTEVPDTAGSTVVKDIVGNQKFTGEVVEQINVGIGLRKSPESGQGIVTVELAQYENYRIPAQILNLNQAVTEVAGVIPATKFPADRNSQVNCSVQLPEMPDDSLYEATVYMVVYGVGSLLSGITVDSAKLAIADYPAGTLPIVNVMDAMQDIPAGTDAYMLEASTSMDLTGYSGGSIYYELGLDTPGVDVKMLQTGVKLSLK